MVNEQQYQWAKAHRCAWGSKADLSGLIQQKSCSSSESYLEKVTSTFLLLVLVERCQDTQCMTVNCVWGWLRENKWTKAASSAPDLSMAKDVIVPDLGNIWEIVFYSPGFAKKKKTNLTWWESHGVEAINQISGENCFQCIWLLISEVIPHQQTTKTLNLAGPSTFHVFLSTVTHLLIRCPLVN